ncbi:spermidine synthase [Rubripirellula tenax]|uniref:Spermidine synthase n=1 Tax=Rubripirellula tenax TaxID=2528015 RepID=A0A5C6ENZ8_9BACT|nr:fused MFS/spermidine synthase [Rubripirellula tenax]TWU50792.1 spermidine synthase [Rubripirellula tenax]
MTAQSLPSTDLVSSSRKCIGRGFGKGETRSIFWFAATTLLGAFLVFQVQPVISKCVLPWFGGTPAVWTTCMLFFQILLFGGYLYAHVLRTFFRPAVQGCIHLCLLSAAALVLPIEPADAWKPIGTESPTMHLLAMLAAHVGLPYFVLSSTGPLIQAWLSYQDNSDRVYRLYALSNAGSLVALLSYPFAVEPVLSVSNQSMVWSLMFCVFVLVQGVVAIGLFRVGRADAQPVRTAAPESIGWRQRSVWVALPALASTMLLVVTNHVCQDVAVIPFLWVLPLSLYLVSFIICFDSPQWYKPKLIAAMTLISVFGIQAKTLLPGSVQLIVEVTMYMTLLLGVCLLCHGEVARVKPSARLLTQYYALLSAGGAIGGIIVAIACPMLLSTSIELPFTLSVVTSMAFLLFFACRGWMRTDYDWSAAYRLRFAAVLLMVAPMVSMMMADQDETISSKRNFFGTLQVLRDDAGVRLVHGSTIHGMQRGGTASAEPTTYYGRESGIGRAIMAMQGDRSRLKIGVVGLGCGVLATYGRASDEFDMIEINPAVVEIARENFSFLSDSQAISRVHLGDGRLVLERMTDQKFDLLVLDAFSSDAIPAHLLTREAIALYRDRLAEGGILAIHVSNNHLDLVPLVHRLGRDGGLETRVVRSPGEPSLSTQHATWMLMTEMLMTEMLATEMLATETPENGGSHPIWGHVSMQDAQPATEKELAEAPLWTDQQHNLVSVLRLW